MKPDLIPILVSQILPESWRGLEVVKIENSSYESTWLLHLWKYSAADEKRIRAVAEKLPVIPTVASNACVLSRRLTLLVGEMLPEPMRMLMESVEERKSTSLKPSQ